MPPEEQLVLIGKFALAGLLGALIGTQRQLRDYPVGTRTLALVASGAALFTSISNFLGADRVAAGIVTGIGFLGAGVIFREGDSVRGITTAATIWVAAAIGTAVGMGLYLAAWLATFIVLLVLGSRPLVHRMEEPLRRLLGRGEIPTAKGTAKGEEARRH